MKKYNEVLKISGVALMLYKVNTCCIGNVYNPLQTSISMRQKYNIKHTIIHILLIIYVLSVFSCGIHYM